MYAYVYIYIHMHDVYVIICICTLPTVNIVGSGVIFRMDMGFYIGIRLWALIESP